MTSIEDANLHSQHNHFRQTWNLLWGACEAKRRPQGMSLKQFINEGLRFVQQLTMHHGIEEAHIFPRLATRMPEFRVDLQHQHHEIHDGLVVFEEYLKRCRDGKCDFELAVLQEKMQPWEKVLWDHLDDEVRALGAENMRRYWTKEEMLRMPM